MADNGFKINKSLNLNPQASAPSNATDGDFYYDSTIQSFVYYHNGSWANLDSVGTVSSTLWMTGDNTFTPFKVQNSVVKVSGSAILAHLAGISSSFSGKQITIYNGNTATIVVEPEDANELTANNRILTPTGGSMNLVAGEVAVFVYDVVATRWLLVSISSNAGAQVIATDANPGLVTLHQPSLLPLDGVVLSDGDLNTVNGVVGLDADGAVVIAAPTSAVTALTVTANGAANAATFNGPIEVGGGSGSSLLVTPKSPAIATVTIGALGMESFTNGGVTRARLRSGISASERNSVRTAITAAAPWTSSDMYYWVDSECVVHVRGNLYTNVDQTFNTALTVILKSTVFPAGLRPTVEATGFCMVSNNFGALWVPALFYVRTDGDIAVIQASGTNLTTVREVYGISIDYPLFT